MTRAYQVLGWALVLLGTVHMATTLRAFDTPSSGAVWFFGAGIAIALTGAINLLNRVYGPHARGLRWTCIGTNTAMTGFGFVAGMVTHASAGELIVVVGLLAATTLLSTSRGALMKAK